MKAEVSYLMARKTLEVVIESFFFWLKKFPMWIMFDKLASEYIVPGVP